MRSSRRALLARHPAVVIPDVAAQFSGAAHQYWTVADNAALSMGTGAQLSMIGWVKFSSFGANRACFGKGSFGVPSIGEYTCVYNTSSQKLEFYVYDGSSAFFAQANVFGIPPLNTWLLLGCRFDGLQISLSVNGGTPNFSSFTGTIQDAAGAFQIGGNSVSGVWMDGLIDDVLVYRRALSINEVTMLYANGAGLAPRDLSGSLLTGLAGAWDLAGTGVDSTGASTLSPVAGPTTAVAGRVATGGRVFFDGNSMTASQTYPSQSQTLLGPAWTYSNVAVSGQTTIDMLSRAAVQVDQYRVYGARQIVSCWEGTNDLFFGANAADAYARLVQYCSERRALGFKVMILTILPRAVADPFEANRLIVNANIRANWSSFADAMCDLTTDPNIGYPGACLDTTYYTDGTHMNNAGSGIVAGMAVPIIQRFT